ncbi:MAG: Holliday junction branch migration protein RuvA [Deltaproteobacteria bacterium]|nr:Holliday junction branch migration protein RuvA [Deltaproteobacteria bacterium]
MIGYLEGSLLRIGEDRILLLANQVGYEVLLPAYVVERMRASHIGDPLALYIYYQQTERQPKPVLIGFNTEEEKEFFQYFISVADIGPLKAVKAMTLPVGDMARAIEAKDLAALRKLKGIGGRTAQKIIATLSGKMERFASPTEAVSRPVSVDAETADAVIDVLVSQLGHKVSDARRLVAEALERNSAISTPEELFEEVYRGESKP